MVNTRSGKVMAATELDRPDHIEIPAYNSAITQQQAGSSGQGLLSQDPDDFIIPNHLLIIK